MKKILITLIILSFISCASRKVNKSITTATQTSEVIKKDTLAQSSTKEETTIDTSYYYTHELEPIDSTKEFIVDGKVFKNVRINTTKKQKGITTFKTEKDILNVSKNESEKVSTNIKEDIKDSERKSGFPWWIIIVLIIIGRALFYYEYKRK